jgi:hypothetical protein
MILPEADLRTKNDNIVFLVFIPWSLRTAPIPTFEGLETPEYKGINVSCIAERTEAPGPVILLLNLGPCVRWNIQKWRRFATAGLTQIEDEKDEPWMSHGNELKHNGNPWMQQEKMGVLQSCQRL